MRRIQRFGVIVAAGLLIACLLNSTVLTTVAQACPNCKEAMAANDPSQSGLVKGYFYSILLMMGTPFTVLGLFSAMMYREVLKARAAQSTAMESELSHDSDNGSAEVVPAPDSNADR